MDFQKIVMPSRNFNILGNILINDPKDGKEKIACHSYSYAKCGVLIIIDPETLTGETYETPGDAGAWALCQCGDMLIVGTCPNAGYVYRFDLVNRTWAGEPVKATREATYVWTLELASDGFVYGGTYHDCRLFRYDPASHTTSDLGRVDPDEKNMYSRWVFCGVPGRLFINCIAAVNRVFVYDLDTKAFSQFYEDGVSVSYISSELVCLNKNGEYGLFDPYTGGKLYDRFFKMDETEALSADAPVFAKLREVIARKAMKMKNGVTVGIQGQEMFKLSPASDKPEYHAIPGGAPATAPFAVCAAEDGRIWGTSSFGMTAFCYDPKTGGIFNTLDLSIYGGECYGIVPYGGKIYFTSYAGGEHIEYDPNAPWNMRENINPKAVNRLTPKYIRPHARSVTNGDGVIWTGWWANYGSYGGAVTKWDVKTGKVSVFDDLPIGDYSIEDITQYKDGVIFDTVMDGNGLARDSNAVCSLYKMNGGGEIIQKKDVSKGLGAICVNGERGIINICGELHLLDAEKLDVTPLGMKISGVQLERFGEYIIAVGNERGCIIDLNSGKAVKEFGGTGVSHNDICVNGNDVWAVGDGWLLKITIE